MISIADGSVQIQTSAEGQAATPSWLGEVALVASHLQKQGILNKIAERVRFARRRFGRYDVIDFLAVQIALRYQWRADAGSVLRGRAFLCGSFHGLVRTHQLACGLDPQPLFSRAARRTGGSPARALSGRSAGPPSLHRRAGRRIVGSAGNPLAGLRCRWDTGSSPSTGVTADAGSARSTATFASPLCPWLHARANGEKSFAHAPPSYRCIRISGWRALATPAMDSIARNCAGQRPPSRSTSRPTAFPLNARCCAWMANMGPEQSSRIWMTFRM
jgi:hypothetical protein